MSFLLADRFATRIATLLVALCLPFAAAGAQETKSAPARAPISIGDYPNVNGLRLNFRDSQLGRVNGANVTIWSPYSPATGTVKGFAIGLPVTGARDITGIGLGVFGVGADHDLTGINIGGIGAGAGGRVKGLAGGLVGVGAGGDLDGIIVGGIGAGAGGNAKGIILGGIGAGVGGDLQGFAFGGIGAGAGGNIKGIVLGGVGTGAGGNITGIVLSGIGTGAGGRIEGFAFGGVGVGAGSEIKGVALGIVGVGAPRLEGGFGALFVGAQDAKGVIVAPAQLRIERGSFTGVSLSANNYIRGAQHGLTIGLLNYARTLNGVQLGVLNIVADAKDHPVLPLINWGSR